MHTYAWITYVNNDEYLNAARVLYYNLRELQTKYKLVIMVPEGHQLELFEGDGIEFIDIPDLQQSSSAHASERYRFCINKIFLWTLVQYDKLCWLDVDLLLLHNIDELFDLEMGSNAIIAAPGCTCNSLNNPKFHTLPSKCPFNNAENIYMNAGVFITKPCMRTYEYLALEQTYDFPLAEQDAFNQCFEGKIGVIPSKFNYLNHLPIAHPKVDQTDISVFHFGYGKPWDRNVLGVRQDLYDLWNHRCEKMNKKITCLSSVS